MKNLKNSVLLSAALLCGLAALPALSDETASQSALPETAPSGRVLALEGGRNFRDLGGYATADGRRVKWGKLYRSGALHKLTDADYGIIQELGIATVVDFRSTEERAGEPTRWRAGEINHLTWDYAMDYGDFAQRLRQPQLDVQDMENLMTRMYTGMVHQHKAHYRAMFEHLVHSGEPLLFHCTAGKDRTGVGAALVLAALGVERELILQDYVLTDSVLDAHELMQLPESASDREKAMFEFFAGLPQPVVEALMAARPGYLESAFAEMARHSGSVDAYIREELGVSELQLASLRRQFLE